MDGAPGEIVRHIPVPLPSASLCSRKIAPGDFVERSSYLILQNDKHQKSPLAGACFMLGAPGEIRTPDRSVRSRVLYPAELQALNSETRFYGHLTNLTSLISVFTTHMGADIAQYLIGDGLRAVG